MSRKWRNVSPHAGLLSQRAPRRPGGRIALWILLPLFLAGSFRAVGAASLPPVPGEVLVRLADPSDRDAITRLAIREDAEVAKENGTLGYLKLRLRNTAASTADVAARLTADPAVDWAESNGLYAPTVCPRAPVDPMLVDLPDALPENQWSVYKTNIFDLWRYGSGGDPSVVIAIVDTGIDDFAYPHPDLADNVLAVGYDTVDGDGNPTDVGGAAFSGHGTHVAGIAAAVTNGEGIAGVAYCSSILVVRAMDCGAGDNCPGTYEDIADGIQLAADYGADVINLSLGGTEPSNLVRTAVQYAIGKGAIVVAASGNDSAPALDYPAAYPEVIAVGATDVNDDVADFSNWGDELDVVAPGVDIYSTFPGDTYVKRSGTSMASPFVAGLAALLVAENSSITQAEAELYLRAHTVGLSGANATRDGFGRVQFLPLSDWSDAPPPYPAASHGNFAWEWLGDEASPELGIADPIDGDHRPNIGAPGAVDGYDDGVFRESVFTLPILPPHLGGGAEAFEALLGVANPSSPRYGSEESRKVHLDIWADWDSDHSFEDAAAEHVVADASFDPTGWGGDRFLADLPITPVDEHIYGNPVVVRSRLAYGASAGSPDGAVPHGEVEDDVFINFVEEFDLDHRVHVPGVYISGSWGGAADPTPWCAHRGSGGLATTAHPNVGVPCNEAIEGVTVMATPDMDWTEYTAAFIRVWYCHQLFDDACSTLGDHCRIRVDRNGVKIDLGPIPIGSGTLSFDVSDLVGTDVVRVEFVEDTDLPGTVAIDDVTVWAYDGEDPVAITGLGVSRAAGERELDLDWSAPDENLYIPTPPADGEANVYDVRYSENPITTEGDWLSARPVRPGELTAAPPVPGAPGAGQAASFRTPSAFPGYSVAVRTMDETTNLSALSNSPAVANTPSLGVTVVGQGEVEGSPGEVVIVDFRITNTGNTTDDYALTATDTEGWELQDFPGWIRLEPSTSAIYGAHVKISSAASNGDVDSVTVTAISMASSTVSGSGVETILVQGATDVPGNPELSETVGAYALRLSGRHPFRDRLDLTLELPASAETFVGVYSAEGRRVRELLSGEALDAGRHPLVWDGRDARGNPVPSGTFFLLVRTPEWSQRRSVVIVR